MWKIRKCQRVVNGKRCENRAADWVIVKFKNGDSKVMDICEQCLQNDKDAEQNAHLTLGESAPSQTVFNAEAVSTSDGVPPSAPAQVA